MATRGQQKLITGVITGVVTGQVGIGKSTLINNILSKDVTVPGHAKMAYAGKHLERGTTEVQMFYEKSVFGSNLRIFDTPGWSDTSVKSHSDAQIIEDICKKTEGQVDFLYYCVSGRQNVNIADQKIFKLLNSKFTRKIWNQTIFVVTFCNEMSESPNNFEKKMISYKEQLRKALSHCGIPDDETEDILVVPAGDRSLSIWQQGGKQQNWMEYLIEETRARVQRDSTCSSKIFQKKSTCTIS